MIIEELLENTQTAEWVLNLALQSMIVLLTGWFLSRLLKKKAAPLRSGVTLMTLAALILLPLLTLITYALKIDSYHTSLPFTWSIHLDFYDYNQIGAERIHTGKENSILPAEKDKARLPQAKSRSIFSTPKEIINGLGMIWFAGFLVFLSRILYGAFYIKKLRKGLIKVVDTRLERIIDQVKQKFANKAVPGVYTSHEIKSPIASGFVNPIIVIPHDIYENLSDSEIKGILFHEVSHILNKDQVVGIMQRFVIALNWWNPLVYSLSADFSKAREEISDNFAIIENNSAGYAECLINLAEKTTLLSPIPAAIGLASPHIPLQERIKKILSRERVLDTKLKKSLFAALLLGAFLLPGLMITHNFAFSTKVAEFPEVLAPRFIHVDGDELFIPEGPTTSVYSLKTFKRKFKFGKSGEGPGEFTGAPFITILPNYILSQDRSKMAWFSRKGKFIKERKLEGFFSVFPFNKKFVGWQIDISRVFAKNRATGTFFLCDSELNKIKELIKYERIPHVFFPPGVKKNAEWVVLSHYVGYDCDRESKRIFVADSKRGFYIAVFDERGNKLYTIDKKIKKIKISEAFKQEKLKKLRKEKYWQDLKNRKLIFYEHFPQIASFRVTDGKIYVYTHKREKNKVECIILDLKGNILKKVFLPVLSEQGDISRIRYGKFYQLIKNKQGIWELHITNI